MSNYIEDVLKQMTLVSGKVVSVQNIVSDIKVSTISNGASVTAETKQQSHYIVQDRNGKEHPLHWYSMLNIREGHEVKSVLLRGKPISVKVISTDQYSEVRNMYGGGIIGSKDLKTLSSSLTIFFLYFITLTACVFFAVTSEVVGGPLIVAAIASVVGAILWVAIGEGRRKPLEAEIYKKAKELVT